MGTIIACDILLLISAGPRAHLMLFSSKLWPLLVTKREFRSFKPWFTVLIVTPWTRFELRFFARTQRRSLAAADSVGRHDIMNSVWSVLQLIITRARHILLLVEVDVSLRVHLDLWSLADMRIRLILSGTRILIMAFSDQTGSLLGT